jgi:predicted O-methyltransferase YrrM
MVEVESNLRRIGGVHLHIHSIHLYKLISSLPENAIVLEIGVGIGRSTKIILFSLNGTLYSIDINDKRNIAQGFSNWKFIQGYDLDILSHWNIPLDLVFVDLDRDSDINHYKQILEYLVPHMKENGIFIFYNTIVFSENIIPAIQDFLSKYPDYKFLNIKSKHGFGIIAKDIELIKEILNK